MSKKKVLNEVRRFMKLANLDANLSSNFVNKLDEMDHEYKRDDDEAMQEEEEMEMDMEVEEEPMLGDEEMEMDLEMDVDVEEEAVLTDDEAAILIALGQKLAAAQEMGAEEEVEDAMDDLDDADELEDEAEDLEMDAADDLADAADDLNDETLEEILNDVLGEETEETKSRYKRNRAADEKQLDDLESDIRYDKRRARQEGAKKGDPSKTRPGDEDFEARKGSKSKTHSGLDYMQEDLVQEVLKRVRTRLAAMSKK